MTKRRAFGGQLAATLLANELDASRIPSSMGFTLSFLMCLIALVVGLGFLAVQRRAPGGRAAEVAVRRDEAYPEPERSAA